MFETNVGANIRLASTLVSDMGWISVFVRGNRFPQIYTYAPIRHTLPQMNKKKNKNYRQTACISNECNHDNGVGPR